MDQWAAKVAAGLSKWVAGFRDCRATPNENDANTLIVLAGQKYIEPLRERGVFEYGISRMAGNPNEGYKFPLRMRHLFEESDAGDNGEQMGWMFDAIDTLDAEVGRNGVGGQGELGRWTGEDRECEEYSASAREMALVKLDGVVYCADCRPSGQCTRCDTWTNKSGLSAYSLCLDC